MQFLVYQKTEVQKELAVVIFIAITELFLVVKGF